MSKMRMINTRFWIDDYISNLDPIEKLVFLYFLTNPMTDICGIYEVPLKIVAVETGIDKEMVVKILARFERDNKIFYDNGWVAIKNFRKHQSINPKVDIGIKNGLSKAPKGILDRLSIDYHSLSHLNPNSNPNPNPNSNTKPDSLSAKAPLKKYNPLGEQVIKAFEAIDPKNKTSYGNKTQRAACDFLIEEYTLEKVLDLIPLLSEINKQKLYIGQITTPYELKNNWIKLGNAWQQLKTNKKPNFII